MKKIFFLASLSALALASCSDDFNPGNKTTYDVPGDTKLIARFEAPNGGNDTRTTIQSNGNGYYNYTWSQTDGIGLFNQPSEGNTDKTNAPFDYAGENEDGGIIFKGFGSLLNTEVIYGQYPFTNNAGVTNTEGTYSISNVVIAPYQNFNGMVSPLTVPVEEVPTSYAVGSFSQYAAPAVGIGTIQDSEVDMTFYPVSSFIVVPVYGYSKISTVQLTVQDSEDAYQPLTGQINVDDIEALTEAVSKTNQGPGLVEDEEATYAGNVSDGSAILLNCGNDLELNLDNATYLWFVVPANLNLSESTITLTFDEDTKNAVSISLPEQAWAGRNKVRVIGAGENNNEAVYYNPDNVYTITTQAQFLEYAHLVTSGLEAVNEYNTLYSTDKYDSYKKWTLLPDMITLSDGTESISTVDSADDYTVKNAMIVNALDFTGYGAVLEQGIGSLGTGVFSDSQAVYLQDVYGGIISGEGIPTIGGQTAFSITGMADEAVTITGLPVNGNGLFTSGNQYKVNINNLEFINTTVNVKGVEATAYYFLSDTFAPSTYQTGVIYNDVTVGSGCNVIGYTGETNVALFNLLYSGNMNDALNVVDYSESSLTVFANTLNMYIAEADFTGVWTVDSFNNILVSSCGVLAKVTGESGAETVIAKVKANPANSDNVPYSIYSVSGAVTTSYWTGTSYAQAADGKTNTATSLANNTIYYAEQLAWVNDNGNSSNNAVYTLANNLDLMGDPTTIDQMVWKLPSNTTIAGFGIDGQNNTISNVYIDGTFSGSTTNNYYSMFGQFANAMDLTIDGMTIDNSAENANANAQIAAIANQPSKDLGNAATEGNNLVVKNYVVLTEDDFNLPVGGLFYDFSTRSDNFNAEGSSLTFDTTETTSGLAMGWLAATYAVTLTDYQSNLDFPEAENNVNAYAKTSVTIDPGTGAESMYVYVSGFSYTGDVQTAVNELVANFTGSGNALNNYTIYVVINGGTTQYIYKSSNGKFVGQGTGTVPTALRLR